ncbi:MAG: mycofactocin biosynthesis chaperone MftB [Ilumatobacteraceae bacterium]
MRRLLTARPETITSAGTIVERTALRLDPDVALRPEPFGALAYHYGTRRLVFLKHPDVVRVVEGLDGSTPTTEVLESCGIPTDRRAAVVRALDALVRSGIITEVAA